MKELLLLICVILVSGCYVQEELKIYDSLESGLVATKIKKQKVFLVFDFLGNPTNSVQDLVRQRGVKSKLDSITVVILNIDEPSERGIANRKLQQEKFGIPYQPGYYILNGNGAILKGPIGYIKKGISNFYR